MKDKVKKVFNDLASVYEHGIDQDSLYNSEYERPAMLKQLPEDLSGKKVLDAGCAAGWYTQKLLERGADVIATDISPDMVEATQRRVKEQAKVLCMDLEAAPLPFLDCSFDYIVSSLTLHYINDWERIFREFKRILKPKGKLLFSIHHPITDITWKEHPKYFSTELIIDTWNKEGNLYEVPFYRRPLQDVFNITLQYFSIQQVVEPQPTVTFKEKNPKGFEKLMKRPQFLIIDAHN